MSEPITVLGVECEPSEAGTRGLVGRVVSRRAPLPLLDDPAKPDGAR